VPELCELPDDDDDDGDDGDDNVSNNDEDGNDGAAAVPHAVPHAVLPVPGPPELAPNVQPPAAPDPRAERPDAEPLEVQSSRDQACYDSHGLHDLHSPQYSNGQWGVAGPRDMPDSQDVQGGQSDLQDPEDFCDDPRNNQRDDPRDPRDPSYVMNKLDTIRDPDAPDTPERAAKRAAERRNVGEAFYQEGCTLARNGNPKQALSWWRGAASMGHGEACMRAAEAFRAGRGTRKSYRMERRMIFAAAAAGHAEGQYAAGLCCSHRAARLAWLKLAAAQGHADAMCSLGMVAELGGATDEARQHYEGAVAAGSVQARVKLGCLLRYKPRTDADLATAAELFNSVLEADELAASRTATKGAHHNMESHGGTAAYELALMLFDGVGVPKACARARILMATAVEYGCQPAMLAHAHYLLSTRKDVDGARRLARRAYVSGVPGAAELIRQIDHVMV